MKLQNMMTESFECVKINGILRNLNNDEMKIYKKVKEDGKLFKKDMSEYDINVANRMVTNGLLRRKKAQHEQGKHGRIYFVSRGRKGHLTTKELDEVAPPGRKEENWIKKNKKRFKEKYGKDYGKYLYGHAWKMYNGKVNESAYDTEYRINVSNGTHKREVKANIRKIIMLINNMLLHLKPTIPGDPYDIENDSLRRQQFSIISQNKKVIYDTFMNISHIYNVFNPDCVLYTSLVSEPEPFIALVNDAINTMEKSMIDSGDFDENEDLDNLDRDATWAHIDEQSYSDLYEDYGNPSELVVLIQKIVDLCSTHMSAVEGEGETTLWNNINEFLGQFNELRTELNRSNATDSNQYIKFEEIQANLFNAVQSSHYSDSHNFGEGILEIVDTFTNNLCENAYTSGDYNVYDNNLSEDEIVDFAKNQPIERKLHYFDTTESINFLKDLRTELSNYVNVNIERTPEDLDGEDLNESKVLKETFDTNNGEDYQSYMEEESDRQAFYLRIVEYLADEQDYKDVYAKKDPDLSKFYNHLRAFCEMISYDRMNYILSGPDRGVNWIRHGTTYYNGDDIYEEWKDYCEELVNEPKPTEKKDLDGEDLDESKVLTENEEESIYQIIDLEDDEKKKMIHKLYNIDSIIDSYFVEINKPGMDFVAKANANKECFKNITDILNVLFEDSPFYTNLSHGDKFRESWYRKITDHADRETYASGDFNIYYDSEFDSDSTWENVNDAEMADKFVRYSTLQEFEEYLDDQVQILSTAIGTIPEEDVWNGEENAYTNPAYNSEEKAFLQTYLNNFKEFYDKSTQMPEPTEDLYRTYSDFFYDMIHTLDDSTVEEIKNVKNKLSERHNKYTDSIDTEAYQSNDFDSFTDDNDLDEDSTWDNIGDQPMLAKIMYIDLDEKDEYLTALKDEIDNYLDSLNNINVGDEEDDGEDLNESYEGKKRIAGFYHFDNNTFELLPKNGTHNVLFNDELEEFNLARFGIETFNKINVCYIEAPTKELCLKAKKAIDNKYKNINIDHYDLEYQVDGKYEFEQLNEAKEVNQAYIRFNNKNNDIIDCNLIIHENGKEKVIGVLDYEFSDGLLELDYIQIDKEYRNKGYATRVLLALKNYYKPKKVFACICSITAFNIAVKVFKKPIAITNDEGIDGYSALSNLPKESSTYANTDIMNTDNAVKVYWKY